MINTELSNYSEQINRIDQAICDAENEVEAGAQLISLQDAMERMDKYITLNITGANSD